MSQPPADDLGRACAALLDLAAERPWRHITLRDVAEHADVPLARVYEHARSKQRLLAEISAKYDLRAMEAADASAEDVHDRLFESVMARIEVMQEARAALTAMANDLPALALAPHFPPTARAILEAAGVEATAPRLAAMAAVWARVVQVWRDDEGALNRTMAEIDQRLKQMRARLSRIGAGF